MLNNIKHNRSLLTSGLETIMIGVYFIANSFRFNRPDFFNSMASHIDDPPFAAIAIILGTIATLSAIYDIKSLVNRCYVILTFVWIVYAVAFMIQNIELFGHPFARLDCWLMFAVAGRIILDAWAGDTP